MPRDGIMHWEDFREGEMHALGSREMGREEILAFARAFDPQSFHVDEEAARGSAYGGLIASGWHTGSVFMRLLVDGLIGASACMGSPGVQDLRWPRPVRPGDTLRASVRVGEAAPSRSRPDRGTVRFTGEMTNQRDETVLALEFTLIIGRRGDGAAP